MHSRFLYAYCRLGTQGNGENRPSHTQLKFVQRKKKSNSLMKTVAQILSQRTTHFENINAKKKKKRQKYPISHIHSKQQQAETPKSSLQRSSRITFSHHNHKNALQELALLLDDPQCTQRATNLKIEAKKEWIKKKRMSPRKKRRKRSIKT